MRQQTHGIVFVSGFIQTGSSALIDLLRGQDAFEALLPEFKIFAGADGLYELVTALDSGRGEAMKVFKRFRSRMLEEGRTPVRHSSIRSLNRRKSTRRYARKSYNSALGGGYTKTTRAYLKELKREIYSGTDKAELKKAIQYWTTRYLHNIASIIDPYKSSQYMIFNQTVKPSSNTSLGLSLVENSKLIAVDRNPCDQFVELVNTGRLESIITNYGDDTGNIVNDYINWYMRRRRDFQANIRQVDNILVVTFEDIVNHTEKTISQIYDFVDLEYDKDSVDTTFFDGKYAKEKINMWHEFEDQDSINAIRDTLLNGNV